MASRRCGQGTQCAPAASFPTTEETIEMHAQMVGDRENGHNSLPVDAAFVYSVDWAIWQRAW